MGDEGARPARLRGLWSAVLAVVLALLLLDAAVETFLSGSPIRWTVGGIVAGYLGLTALLLRRLRWSTMAAASLLVFLGILSLTAWQPDGLLRGVVLLRQPTATVLAAVTALSLLASVVILLQEKAFPRTVKVVLGILAAYGIAAFAVAIQSGTPYPALFRGGSLWDRLPFWLQGAFVGALILIPVALVVAIVRGLGGSGLRGIGKRALGTPGLQVASLGLCVVIATAGLRAPTDGIASGGPPRPFLPDSIVDQETNLAAARRLLELSGMRTADIGAAATAIGRDPDALLGFVRGLSFDPYRGSMRGDLGTLMARGGNALDRSLLLSSLLRRHGYRVRLVHGRLSDGEAQRLLELARVGPTPPPLQNQPMSLEEAARKSGLPVQDLHALRRAVDAKRDELGRILRERVRRDVTFLQGQLAASRIQIQPRSRLALEDVRNHAWVQAEIEGAWRDLDSLAPPSQAGGRMTEPDGEIPIDALPESWLHTLGIRLVATYGSAERARKNEVLNVSLRVPDLAGRWLVLGFPPQDGGDPPDHEKANAFQPVLVSGRQQHKGRTVYLDASAARSTGPSGLFGAVAGGGAPDPLAQLDLEFTLRAPGAEDLRITRTIVQPPQAATSDIAARIAQSRMEIVSLYHFVVAGGPASTEWMASLQLATAERAGGERGEIIPFDLLYLAEAMTRAEPGEVAGGPKGPRRYYARPIVLGQRVRVRKNPHDHLVLVKSVDILHNRSEVLSDDPIAAVRQGVLETHLERLLFEGLEVANTTVVFERTRASTLVLRPGDSGRLDGLALSASARERIQEDLAAGYVVVVPRERVRIAGAMTTGWWRVHPNGGETLGRMESGEGQGMTERIILTIPSAYAWGMGWYCKREGLQRGICDPCAIMLAGGIGGLLGVMTVIYALEKELIGWLFWVSLRLWGGGKAAMSVGGCVERHFFRK